MFMLGMLRRWTCIQHAVHSPLGRRRISTLRAFRRAKSRDPFKFIYFRSAIILKRMQRTIPKHKRCISPNLQKSSQNSPQIQPKSSPNPPKTLPKTPQISENSNFGPQNDQSEKKTAFPQCCLGSWTPFWRPKRPQGGPRASQKLPKYIPKREKINIEKHLVFGLVFFTVLVKFWLVFGMNF